MAASRKLTFKRFGRSYHLRIQTAEDLRAVLDLNEAHWVATAAPIETINCDATFLKLVDTDHNGRILCYELKDAIAWLLKTLCDTSGVSAGSTTLRLAAIDTDREEGSRIERSARKMLAQLGQPEAEEIALEQARRIRADIEAASVSGAGVVLPEAATDPEVKQFLSDIVETVGGVLHPSGAQGVNQSQLDQFLSDAKAYVRWHGGGEIPAGHASSEAMPLGTDTPAAYGLLVSLRGKIDQYFAQCRAVALDPQMARQIGPRLAELESLDFGDPGIVEDVLKKAPLARPRASRALSFADQINPYYAPKIAQLRAQVMERVLGNSGPMLSEPQWQQLKAAFAAHEAWVVAKCGGSVEPLGLEKLTAYLDGRLDSAVRALLAESVDAALVLDNIRLTEKLILYQAYLISLANNFVSFPHLYNASRRAMFEMGSLVMDGRWFNMSVRVGNRAEHAGVAKTSNLYVLYCEITPRQGGPKYEVAVPVTSGGKGNLCVGKRGVFEDISGNECDVRVVHILENPISIGEALVSPFQRMGRLVTGKIESITAQAEKKLDTTTTAAVTQAPTREPTVAEAQRRPSGMMSGGLLAGGGLAVAAVGSSVAYFTKTLAGLTHWKILIGVGSAVLAVMLPISIIALIKLRRRDLSGILEGSGWAVNARMRLTRRLGRFFTLRPRYPKDAKGIRRLRWWVAVILVLLIGGLAVAGYLRRQSKRRSQKPVPASASQPGSSKPARDAP